jgi:hypothetical protein
MCWLAIWTAEQHTNQGKVRQALLTSPLLTSVELDHGSGVILAARHAWARPGWSCTPFPASAPHSHA